MNRNNGNNGMKFQLTETAICLVAVVLGVIYLNTDWISLDFLLPVYAVFFAALPILRLIEARAKGNTGWVAALPAVCYLLLALVVIAATVVYFAQKA